MVKIKRVRTIDCVVIGWRPGTVPDTVGSLILGLYDAGRLRPVGHCAGFTETRKRELLQAELAPYETGDRGSADQPLERRPRAPGGSGCAPSSWRRSATTTPAADASVTGRACCASGTTASPRAAPPTSSRRERRLTRPDGLFVATAGAAAAWPGSCSWAISINVERILSFKGSPERALEALLVLVGALVVAVLCLAPVETDALGWLLLVAGVVLAAPSPGWSGSPAQPPRPLGEGRDRPGHAGADRHGALCRRRDHPARGGGRWPLLGPRRRHRRDRELGRQRLGPPDRDPPVTVLGVRLRQGD